MTRLVLGLLFGISSSLIVAQNITISPYSGFGLGERQFDQNVVLSGMAHTSSTYMGPFGNEANFSNPAANRNMIFSSLSVAGSNTFERLKANNLSTTQSISYISDLNLSFPISNKFKAGIGFQPYSAVGYGVNRLDTIADPGKSNIFQGDGGINSIHAFTSFNINEELSVGVRMNYLFGTIDKSQEVVVENANLITGYNTHNEVDATLFTGGVMYHKELKKGEYLTFGGTYGFSSNLNSDAEFLHSTYYYLSNGERFNVDTIEYFQLNRDVNSFTNYSLGVSYEKSLKYRFAVDVSSNNSSNFVFPNEDINYRNNLRIAVGGWWLPDVNSYKSYLNRVIYRWGGYYETGELEINNTNINRFGITFGLGLPIGKKGKKDPSLLNLSFDLGRQGTTDNNLIEESYVKFKIGFNLSDIWFKKYKIN